MILIRFTLTNFGVFRGEQAIPLSPHGRRPIILFGGKNGAGKSTLLEAIRLCLYGPEALGPRVSRDAYAKYLDSKIHQSSGLIQPTFASLALEFHYADVGRQRAYVVTRAWERSNSGRIAERLEVRCDGNPLNEIAAEHWQDFVRDLIPPGISQLFFFDGEKIQQLAEDTSDQQALADSIKSLLGLHLLERLQTDLSIYTSRLVKPTHGTGEGQQLDELQREINVVLESLARFQVLRDGQTARIADLRSTIGRVESKLASEGGAFARGRESLIQQQAQLETGIRQHEESLRQLCAGLLPFALVPELCSRLKNQLLAEERATHRAAAHSLLASARDEVLRRVESPDIWTGIQGVRREELRHRLAEIIKETLNVEQTEQVQLRHQLSAPATRQVLSWIDQALGELPRTVRRLAAELERMYRELHRTEEALRKVPADEVLKPLLAELHRLHQELAETSKQALACEGEIKAAELRLSELQRLYNSTAEKLASDAMRLSRVRLVPRVQNVLEHYKAALIARKVEQLQQSLSECFNTLCRKKDSLRSIMIDASDFSVTLHDRSGRPLPKAQLSAGEKQIYAISMLWALAKTSGRPLPIIIDTPLARLDSDHRKLLLEQYFPKASHQVLILSTDTEVDRPYFADLCPHVSRAYHLDFDQGERCSRVTTGYFWKGAHEAD